LAVILSVCCGDVTLLQCTKLSILGVLCTPQALYNSTSIEVMTGNSTNGTASGTVEAANGTTVKPLAKNDVDTVAQSCLLRTLLLSRYVYTQ
jgi:hypothetical protein